MDKEHSMVWCLEPIHERTPKIHEKSHSQKGIQQEDGKKTQKKCISRYTNNAHVIIKVHI